MIPEPIGKAAVIWESVLYRLQENHPHIGVQLHGSRVMACTQHVLIIGLPDPTTTELEQLEADEVHEAVGETLQAVAHRRIGVVFAAASRARIAQTAGVLAAVCFKHPEVLRRVTAVMRSAAPASLPTVDRGIRRSAHIAARDLAAAIDADRGRRINRPVCCWDEDVSALPYVRVCVMQWYTRTDPIPWPSDKPGRRVGYEVLPPVLPPMQWCHRRVYFITEDDLQPGAPLPDDAVLVRDLIDLPPRGKRVAA